VFEMTKISPPVHNHSRQIFSDTLRRFFTRSASNTSGAAAIEFGIIVPILSLMVIAIADIGFGVYRKMQVEDAAQAGAEWAIRNGFDSNGISNAVTSATSASIAASPAPQQFCGCATGSSVNSATCGTPCPGGAMAGTYATVSAQLTYNTTLNYVVVPSNYNFSAQSTVRLQ
jgi:Flp pilus assembly protein TadG